MREYRFVLMVAAALAVAGCGTPGAAAADEPAAAGGAQAGRAAGPLTTLGTITARLDGEARTWYVVGDPADARQNSAFWHEPKPGERMIMIAGFDTATPPFASFTRDAGGSVTSYGDYTGSVVIVVLPGVGANPQPRRIALGGGPTLLYAAQASRLDLTRNDPAGLLCAMHEAETGTLDVTAIGFDGDRASVEGAVSATLAGCDGQVALTDGRVQVRNMPRLRVANP